MRVDVTAVHRLRRQRDRSALRTRVGVGLMFDGPESGRDRGRSTSSGLEAKAWPQVRRSVPGVSDRVHPSTLRTTPRGHRPEAGAPHRTIPTSQRRQPQRSRSAARDTLTGVARPGSGRSSTRTLAIAIGGGAQWLDRVVGEARGGEPELASASAVVISRPAALPLRTVTRASHVVTDAVTNQTEPDRPSHWGTAGAAFGSLPWVETPSVRSVGWPMSVSQPFSTLYIAGEVKIGSTGG